MNIIITGASNGVGFEATLELLNDPKHTVVAIARSRENLERLMSIANTLNPGCRLFPVRFDIVNDDYERQLLPFVAEKLQQVDVLINNAGVLVNQPFASTPLSDFFGMWDTNFLGHVKMIQALLPYFNKGAHIVNIGSMGGFQGSVKFPGLAAYSSSKAALHALTECLAVEFAEAQIKVNCLALGSAQTEMLERAFPGYESPVMAFEMGKFIADFALNGHRFFNGKILPVAVTTP